MNFNAKDILGISIIISLLFYIYMFRKETITLGIEERDRQIEQLENENKKFLNYVYEKEKEIININRKNDSLEALKSKVITHNKYINNEIDKSNCIQLVSKFDSIFTNTGIK